MAARVFPSESYALETIMESKIAEACVCMPGIVQEWDAAKQVAKVLPAIRRKVFKDGKPVYEDMPVLHCVPVVIPFSQNAGCLLTVPIRKGDEGILIFADRALDMFQTKGGCQPPECCGGENETTEPRAHSLTDAVFVPGIITRPNVVPKWNDKGIELRDKERKNFIHVGEDGIRLTSGGGLAEGGCDIRMQGGKMWVYSAKEYITAKKESWTEEPPVASGGGKREITMPE